MVRGDPAAEYESALSTLENDVEDGRVSQADADAIKQLAAAFDPEDATQSLPTDLYDKRRTSHKQYSTITGWVERLRLAANHVELTSEDTDAHRINEFSTKKKKAKDGNGNGKFSTSHVRNLEHAVRKFYRYHDGLGVDVDAITVHEFDGEGGSSWDERDLLDAGERAALRTVVDNPRDRAIYHLLLYTGMRNTALRTLRVKDIDLENHECYFNTSADGLKNIHRPDEPRPLFQAERAVRDWLQYHPNPQPENYLITGRPRYTEVDATTPVTRETIRRCMENLKGKTRCPDCAGDGETYAGEQCDLCGGTGESDTVASVEKPCHPHMLRHNFVSMARKHPSISDGDIKFYLGHAEDSNVMETTYSHLSSADHNQPGHQALGVSGAGEDSDDTPPWDSTCQHCDRVLAPEDTECENCGTERESTPWDDQQPASPEVSESGKTFVEIVRQRVEAANPDADPSEIEERVESAISGVVKSAISQPAVSNPSSEDFQEATGNE